MKMTLFLSKKLKEEKDAGVKGKYTQMVEGGTKDGGGGRNDPCTHH
ncbi:MAG: hypothetical protein IPP95_03375 [Flavobacteriales bacterium]|nr:MAG: hypothetical protein IPP95_03375 [Flavobacteriales bacterium]